MHVINEVGVCVAKNGEKLAVNSTGGRRPRTIRVGIVAVGEYMNVSRIFCSALLCVITSADSRLNVD